MLSTITINTIDLPPGTRLQFPAIFEEYEKLIEQLSDRASIRIRFRDNTILLAIPEVWLYKLDNLQIYPFEAGRYLEINTSQVFPKLSLKELIPRYIKCAWQVGSSVALREFEQSLLLL